MGFGHWDFLKKRCNNCHCLIQFCFSKGREEMVFTISLKPHKTFNGKNTYTYRIFKFIFWSSEGSLEEGSAPVWTPVGKMEWFSLQGLIAVWKCLLLCAPLLIPYLGEVGSLGPREAPSCNLQAFLFFLFFGCGVGGWANNVGSQSFKTVTGIG